MKYIKRGFYLFLLLLIFPTVNALSLNVPLYGLNVGSIYAQYSLIVDSMLLVLILVGATQFSLGKHFGKDKGGKAVIIGVGVSLAVAAILLEYRTGYRLGNLWPIAIFIILYFSSYVSSHS